jgi:HSP20 family molecular chaperone IbpA
MAKRPGISVEDFERALDEFFDEMLISRWRRSADDPDELENSQIVDQYDRYEIRIAIPRTDPNRIEVEVSGQRLSVRAPGGPEGSFHRTYSFNAPIESEAVVAKWLDDVLVVSAPKQKPKRIKIND